MTADPTQEELDLLGLLIEDGWPIAVNAPTGDNADVARFQRTAIALLHQGLAGVYDQGFIPVAEAEAIIATTGSWGVWMISTTEAGNALLGAPTEG